MTFVFRGMMVTLGFFGVSYCLLSLLIVSVWWSANLLWRRSQGSSARLLFWLRIFPLLGAALVTLCFALPAFFLLEGGMDEDMGTLLFSAGSLLLIAAGTFRVLTAQAGASQIVEKWLDGARSLDAFAGALKLQSRLGLPPLLLYGVSTPRVLVSETAVALLSPDELRLAVRHEMEHIRSRDNLKKLILHGAPFPGMGSLERAWMAAAELAADEAAVSSSSDAVNLASALIKLCQLVPIQDAPAFTTGFVDMAALVNVRVRRLLDWKGNCSPAVRLGWFVWPALMATLTYTVTHYGQALMVTHQLTEWFIH
jgi:Zn-dependent protease with chaperone function